MQCIDDFDSAVPGALITVHGLDEMQHGLHKIGVDGVFLFGLFHVKR